MNLVTRFSLIAVLALAFSFSTASLVAQEPASTPSGKPTQLKLRTVEAVPGKQPESGPAIGGVSVSVLDGTNATRSTTFWTGLTDERGEVVWPPPIQSTATDPAPSQKRLFVRASKGGYQTATRPISPAAGEEIIALSKWVPWMVRAVDAQTKRPIPTFTVMNRLLAKLSTHYGPATSQNGEALAGFFSENTIRPRQLTIEAPGYETFQIALTPTLGVTNTYELKRISAAP